MTRAEGGGSGRAAGSATHRRPPRRLPGGSRPRWRLWRRRAHRWGAGPGGERGSATAELAVGLPVVLVLLLAGLAAVGAVTTKLQCVDAAREAALAESRGESGVAAGQRAAPSGTEVAVARDGDIVVATVQARVPLLGLRLPAITVDATAVAATEPGVPGSPP